MKTKRLLLLLCLTLTAGSTAWADDDPWAKWKPGGYNPADYLVEPQFPEDPSGICVAWYITKSGHLEVVTPGNGSTPDYKESGTGGSTAPWYSYHDKITSVSCKATNIIGNWAFAGLDKVERFSCPAAQDIGPNAFFNFGISTLYMEFPNLKYVSHNGLQYCGARIISLPVLTYIGEDGISHCPNLEYINLGNKLEEMKAGALAFNYKLVRADGDDRPSVFLSASSGPGFARNYDEAWYTTLWRYVSPALQSVLKLFYDEKVKPSIESGVQMADAKVSEYTGVEGAVSTMVKDLDVDTLAYNLIGELDPEAKRWCCPFGDLMEGNINIAVPAHLFTYYKTAYSSGSAANFSERPTEGYMTYNHEEKYNDDCGPQRMVGKFVKGEFYGLGFHGAEFSCEDVYYADCQNKDFGTSDDLVARANQYQELRLLNCPGVYYLNPNLTNIKKLTLPSYFTDHFTVNPYGSTLSENIDMMAFENCKNLVEVRGYLGEVGQNAFQGCTSLTTVNLSRATSIADNAFYDCAKLSTIGDLTELQSLGKWAFKNCKALTDTISLDLAVIPEGAFANAPITGLTLGDKVKEIGYEAFAGSRLTTLTARRVTSIAQYAFAANTAEDELFGDKGHLNTISLPSIEGIGSNAFQNQMVRDTDDDESDFTVTLGQNLKYIRSYAFAGCTGLEDADDEYESGITLKGSAPQVDATTFQGVNTSKVRLAYSPTYANSYLNNSVWKTFNLSMDVKAFPITYQMASGTATLDADGTLTVNGTGEYQTMQSRPWNKTSQLIKRIVFSDDVTSISAYGFSGLPELKEVVMTKYIKSMGANAFSNCYKLKGVTLSDKLTAIPDRAFANCKALEEINFPSKLETIGNNAFYGCSSLPENLIFPETLVTLGEYAFSGCEEVTRVRFGQNVKEIKSGAFDNTGLCYIYINAPVPPTISTFFPSPSITLDTPEELFWVYFFDGKWSKFTMPRTDETHGEIIGKDVVVDDENNPWSYSIVYADGYAVHSVIKTGETFNSNNGIPDDVLKKIKILRYEGTDRVNLYNLKADKYTSLERVEFPTNSYFNYCFGTLKGFKKLKSVDLGCLTTINDNMFEDCTSLTDIDLSKVTAIHQYAFKGCTSLENVNLMSCRWTSDESNLYAQASIGREAFRGTAVKEIHCQTEAFGEAAFADCKNLRRVEIGRYWKLWWKNYEELKTENQSIFNGCTNLETIVCEMPCPPELATECFEGIDRSKVTLVVPQGTEEIYSNTTGWAGFNVVADENNPYPLPVAGNTKWHGVDGYDMYFNLSADGILTVSALESNRTKTALDFTRDTEYYGAYVKRISFDESVLLCATLFIETNFPNVKELEFGPNMDEILLDASHYPNITDIYCWGEVPPCIGLRTNGPEYTGHNSSVFNGLTLPKSQVKVHVLNYPASVAQAYREDDGWGEFNIVADLTPDDVSVETPLEIVTYVSKPKFASVQYFDENGEEHPDGLFYPSNETAIVKPVILNSKYEFESWEMADEGKEYVTENPTTHELTIQLRFVVENGSPVPLFPNMLTLNVAKASDKIKGDVNGDKTVDVADIASVISVMAGSADYAAADVNGDNTVDVADIATIISIMAANARRLKQMAEE